jgi:hypothetical protein
MNIGEIVKDSLKYPFSDWKKIVILGIIVVMSNYIPIIATLNTRNIAIVSLLGIFGFMIGLLGIGYLFRIMKLSLEDTIGLTEFNALNDMFKDGVKLLVAGIVYLIPAILVIIAFEIAFPSLNLHSNFLGIIGEPFNLLIYNLGSVLWPGILTLGLILYDISVFWAETGIYALIAILYMIIVIPIFLVAIANMAYYEGEFKSAFRFREIFDEITSIGWGKLIKWYITSGILFLIISILEILINSFTSMNFTIVADIFFSLIVVPYFYIFLARSIALFYMPDKED